MLAEDVVGTLGEAAGVYTIAGRTICAGMCIGGAAGRTPTGTECPMGCCAEASGEKTQVGNPQITSVATFFQIDRQLKRAIDSPVIT